MYNTLKNSLKEIKKHAVEVEFPIDDSVVVIPIDKWEDLLDKLEIVLNNFDKSLSTFPEEKRDNNDFKKVPLTPETPRVSGYQCPKCKEIVGKWEVKSHVCSEPIPKS